MAQVELGDVVVWVGWLRAGVRVEGGDVEVVGDGMMGENVGVGNGVEVGVDVGVDDGVEGDVNVEVVAHGVDIDVGVDGHDVGVDVGVGIGEVGEGKDECVGVVDDPEKCLEEEKEDHHGMMTQKVAQDATLEGKLQRAQQRKAEWLEGQQEVQSQNLGKGYCQ
mmetsp:Transcript_38203/g.53137  ORF Transcript_38203/g.53137 Transcript_38203/m.53137 type:complete len:164 (+) Transcript_38203:205-696(+)